MAAMAKEKSAMPTSSCRPEQEYSRDNFEYADTDMLFEQFRMAERACKKYLEAGWSADGGERSIRGRAS